MRSFILSLCLLAVIITGSIMSVKHIDTVSNNMKVENQEILSLLNNEDYDKAQEKLKKLKENLDKHKAILSATMDHSYINNIEIYIAELEEYIIGEQKFDALSKCKVIDMFFEHLPQNYKLKLENIF